MNAKVFDPDHFLGVTKLAPELATAAEYEAQDHYDYGSARQICPGIHLVESNLFLAIAKSVWVFSIRPGKGDNVMVAQPESDTYTGYSDGFLVCAHPFKCEIEVRNKKRKESILKEFEIANNEIFSKHQQ